MTDKPPGRIVKFTPRPRAGVPHPVPDVPVARPDAAANSSEADDYRHRMTMNVAAAAVLTVLVALGLWLAGQMADFRAAQECLSAGARGACAAIRIPDR